MTTPNYSSYIVAPNAGDSSSGGLPIGSVTLWTVATAPSGWLLCNGQAVSRVTYASLFAVLQETYGPGDGFTTFNVPDTRGRAVKGVNTTYTLASTGGFDAITLSYQNLPQHGHSLTDLGHSHDVILTGLYTQDLYKGLTPDTTIVYVGGNTSGGSGNRSSDPNAAQKNTTGITVNDSLYHGGLPVTPQVDTNIVNPYLALNYIIKAY